VGGCVGSALQVQGRGAEAEEQREQREQRKQRSRGAEGQRSWDSPHGAVGNGGRVSSQGVGDAGQVHGTGGGAQAGVDRHPADRGEHAHAGVLQFCLSHPLESGDGGPGCGIGPDVGHDLLAPVLVRPHAGEAYGVEPHIARHGSVESGGLLIEGHGLGSGEQGRGRLETAVGGERRHSADGTDKGNNAHHDWFNNATSRDTSRIEMK
jgi:hypothetical protein